MRVQEEKTKTKMERFSNMISFETPGPQEVQKLERFGLTGESMQGIFFGDFNSSFDAHYPQLENG